MYVLHPDLDYRLLRHVGIAVHSRAVIHCASFGRQSRLAIVVFMFRDLLFESPRLFWFIESDDRLKKRVAKPRDTRRYSTSHVQVSDGQQNTDDRTALEREKQIPKLGQDAGRIGRLVGRCGGL
jgi:hypothetical protein